MDFMENIVISIGLGNVHRLTTIGFSSGKVINGLGNVHRLRVFSSGKVIN